MALPQVDRVSSNDRTDIREERKGVNMAAASSPISITMNTIKQLVHDHSTTTDEELLKTCEEKILLYAKSLADANDIISLTELLVITRPFYKVIGRAKASKLIRSLVDFCLQVNQGKEEKVALVTECIRWAESNQRLFLKRTLQARLIRLYNDIGNYTEAQKIAIPLTAELKKIEDRELMMEVTLEESKSAFYLKNYAKAKASLILARTSANGAYVSTSMQASIDMQSGILYSADEKDFKTAYSYLYEALEGFALANDNSNSLRALKYMCLCKIMINEAEYITLLLATKAASNLKGRPVDAMRIMAHAFKRRSLADFQSCLDEYPDELMNDPVVATYSAELRRTMLEKEISRVMEPYSEIDLHHLVLKINLPQQVIEKAVAQMLLDKKLNGCIDQHNGTIIIRQRQEKDKAFEKAVELIRALSKTVDATYNRAGKLLK